MAILNILEGVAFVTTLFGLYLLEKPSKYNLTVFCCSYVIQGYIFFKREHWFFFFQMIALFTYSMIIYYRWTQKGVG